MKTKISVPKKWWMFIHLFLLGTIAWITAGIANGVIAGKIGAVKAPAIERPDAWSVTKAPREQKDFSYIIRRNIFNSAQSPGEADELLQKASFGAVDEADDAPKTTLDMKLLGTVTDPDGTYRLAIIEIKGEDEQRLFKLNDSAKGATLVKIERNRVLLNRDGKIESLEIDFSQSSKSGSKRSRTGARGSKKGEVTMVSKGEYMVSKKFIESQLANMNKLLTQVRAVPNVDKSGAANGFKLFSVRKGSIFDKIGLKNRDVVSRINGIALDSAEKGLELFQALRNESSFEVDLLRNSRKTTLRFTIQ